MRLRVGRDIHRRWKWYGFISNHAFLEATRNMNPQYQFKLVVPLGPLSAGLKIRRGERWPILHARL